MLPRPILSVILCALLLPGASTAPPARAATPVVIVGMAGPVQPPTAALQADGAPGDGAHGSGVDQPVGRVTPQPILGTSASSLPASADLSPYTPPVENQGDVASCVAWVTAYYMRGWYARRDGYYPGGGPDNAGGFAPMYVYGQIVKGQNTGTTFGAALDLEVAQGIDTRADYTPGDTDYTTQPTAAQQASAAAYKLASYNTLFVGANQGPAAQQAIEASIAGGDPVGIGLPVYDNFWNADSSHYYIDTANMGANHGNHAVVAAKYDANGLWVENQWGTGWGLGGWVELSWSYVNQYIWQAVTIHPAPVSAPSATPVPATATGAPVSPTATSVPLMATATSVATTAPATAVPPSPTVVATATSTPAVLAPPPSPTDVATAITLQPVSAPPARKHRLRALLRLIRLMRHRHTAERARPRPVAHHSGAAAQRHRPHKIVKPNVVRTLHLANAHRRQQQRAGTTSRLTRELAAGYRLLTAGHPRRFISL